VEAEGGMISACGEVAEGVNEAVGPIFLGASVGEGVEVEAGQILQVGEGMGSEVRWVFAGKCVSDEIPDDAGALRIGRDANSEFNEAHINVWTFCLRLVEFFKVEAAFFRPASFRFAVCKHCCIPCCCRRARDAREGRQA